MLKLLARGTKTMPGRLAVCVSVLCLLASGCTSLSGYRDASDPCGSYRETLITANEDAENTFAIGAAVSAGVGLAAGIACAIMTRDAGLCAGVGAGIAALGTGISYWQSQRQKASNKAELQAAIDGEARAADEKLTPVAGALNGLNACRMTQISQLQQRVGQRQIDRPAATTELATIDAAIVTDQKLIDELLGKVDTRATQLAKDKADALGFTFTSYEQQLPAPQPEPAPASTPQSVTTPPPAPSGEKQAGRPTLAQAPRLARQPKPPAKTADAASDLYLNSKELAQLNRQQHDELVTASSNLREMIEIGGGGSVRRVDPVLEWRPA